MQTIKLPRIRIEEGFSPDFIPLFVKFDDQRAKPGDSSEDMTSICSLLQLIKIIVTGASEGPIPLFIPISIKPNHPVILTSIINASFISGYTRFGVTSQYVPAVGCLL